MKTDCSSPSSDKLINKHSHTSTLTYAFMAHARINLPHTLPSHTWTRGMQAQSHVTKYSVLHTVIIPWHLILTWTVLSFILPFWHLKSHEHYLRTEWTCTTKHGQIHVHSTHYYISPGNQLVLTFLKNMWMLKYMCITQGTYAITLISASKLFQYGDKNKIPEYIYMFW